MRQSLKTALKTLGDISQVRNERHEPRSETAQMIDASKPREYISDAMRKSLETPLKTLEDIREVHTNKHESRSETAQMIDASKPREALRDSMVLNTCTLQAGKREMHSAPTTLYPKLHQKCPDENSNPMWLHRPSTTQSRIPRHERCSNKKPQSQSPSKDDMDMSPSSVRALRKFCEKCDKTHHKEAFVDHSKREHTSCLQCRVRGTSRRDTKLSMRDYMHCNQDTDDMDMPPSAVMGQRKYCEDCDKTHHKEAFIDHSKREHTSCLQCRVRGKSTRETILPMRDYIKCNHDEELSKSSDSTLVSSDMGTYQIRSGDANNLLSNSNSTGNNNETRRDRNGDVKNCDSYSNKHSTSDFSKENKKFTDVNRSLFVVNNSSSPSHDHRPMDETNISRSEQVLTTGSTGNKKRHHSDSECNDEKKRRTSTDSQVTERCSIDNRHRGGTAMNCADDSKTIMAQSSRKSTHTPVTEVKTTMNSKDDSKTIIMPSRRKSTHIPLAEVKATINCADDSKTMMALSRIKSTHTPVTEVKVTTNCTDDSKTSIVQNRRKSTHIPVTDVKATMNCADDIKTIIVPSRRKSTHTPITEVKAIRSCIDDSKTSIIQYRRKSTHIPATDVKATMNCVDDIKTIIVQNRRKSTHIPLAEVKSTVNCADDSKTIIVPSRRKSTHTPITEAKSTMSCEDDSKTLIVPNERKSTYTQGTEVKATRNCADDIKTIIVPSRRKSTHIPLAEVKATRNCADNSKTIIMPSRNKSAHIPVEEVKATSGSTSDSKGQHEEDTVTNCIDENKTTIVPSRRKSTHTPVAEVKAINGSASDSDSLGVKTLNSGTKVGRIVPKDTRLCKFVTTKLKQQTSNAVPHTSINQSPNNSPNESDACVGNIRDHDDSKYTGDSKSKMVSKATRPSDIRIGITPDYDEITITSESANQYIAIELAPFKELARDLTDDNTNASHVGIYLWKKPSERWLIQHEKNLLHRIRNMRIMIENKVTECRRAYLQIRPNVSMQVRNIN